MYFLKHSNVDEMHYLYNFKKSRTHKQCIIGQTKQDDVTPKKM